MSITTETPETLETFEQFNFHPLINKAIDLCGYKTPTPVQLKAIPAILARQDVAASAQTGTGKTGAFVLPILQRLASEPKQKKTRILILTPTRELAAQISKAADTYGRFLKFNIVSLFGGASYNQQIRGLSQGAEIVVATPGRLLDHIRNKRLDLSHIDTLILDEADRMLDMGFIDDVRMIADFTPKNRQTLLFSATLDTKLMNMVKDLLNNPTRIDLSTTQLTAPKIKQEFYKVKHMQQKCDLLKKILREENIFKAIIFSATKVFADRLADELHDEGFNAEPLHGDLKQSARTRAVEKLRRGSIQFLVATDVAARGIDIDDVTHVFNFDLPKFCEDYVHRIGRTGRAGKEGKAISFILPADVKNVQRIEHYIGKRIEIKTAEGVIIQQEGENNEFKRRSASRDEYQPRQQERPRRQSRDRDERPSGGRYNDRRERPSARDYGDSSPSVREFGVSDKISIKPKKKSFGDSRSYEPRSSYQADKKPGARRSYQEDEQAAPRRVARDGNYFKSDAAPYEQRPARSEKSFSETRRPRTERSFADKRDDRRPQTDSAFPRRPRPAGDDSRPRSEASFGEKRRPRPEGSFGDSRRARPEGGSGDSRRARPEGGSGDSRRARPEGGFGDSRRARPEGGFGDSRRARPEGGFGDSRRARPEGAPTDAPKRRRTYDDAKPSKAPRFAEKTVKRRETRTTDAK